MIIANARATWTGSLGMDGNQQQHKHFRKIVLPLLEMEDKLGSTVARKLKMMLDIIGLQPSDFTHVCTDGGNEITGAERQTGCGDTGMFKQVFHVSSGQQPTVWSWCLKHLLDIVFGDTDLTLIYDNLNRISKFLRCANRFNKLKPHMMLVMKRDGATSDAHCQARERLDALDVLTEHTEADIEKVRLDISLLC
jgi:hypothetical protein